MDYLDNDITKAMIKVKSVMEEEAIRICIQIKVMSINKEVKYTLHV